MRIAMLGCRGLPATYGGVERHVEEIGARLVERGHEVTVYCRPHYSDADSGSEHRGIRRVVLPGVASKRLDALSHTLVAAAHATRQGFDVVHYHAVGPGLISPLSRLDRGSALVQTIHGLDFAREKWGRGARSALQLSARMSAYLPDRTIVVARSLQEHYRDTYGVETSYVPNGVVAAPAHTDHADRAAGGDAEFDVTSGDYLLGVGRLVPEKGGHLLQEAHDSLPAGARPALLLVGGTSFTGGYVAELRERSRDVADEHLPGFLYGDDLEAAYAHARVFVQSSTLEGMPLTVLEAAAHGLPLVLSDIPVHVQLVGHDRPGARLFASGDAASLAGALRRALADPAAEAAGGASVGRQLVRDFSWDAAADGTVEAYELALEAHRSARGLDRVGA